MISNESKLVNELYQKYPNVFTDKLGCYTGKPVKLELKDNAIQKFCKPRNVPFALKDKIEVEIDRLVREGILTPASNCEWDRL